jgi:hypothetical protein
MPPFHRLTRDPTPKYVVGVPVLPPPVLTNVTTRVRAAIASLHRSMAPPPLRVLESLFGLLDYAALVALCELGVPDALTARLSVHLLAEKIDAQPEALQRLVRYAATRGWVRLDRRGRVVPTPTTRFLAREHPGGWRGWVDFMSGPEIAAAAGSLADAVRNGGDAFAVANGASFFDWNAQNLKRGAAFDAAMAAGGRMHGLALAKAIDWSDDQLVCDVGGGDGSLLDALLNHQPHLSGVLLDLPAVTTRVQPRIAEHVDVVAGDAFDAVPPGASTYLLVNVIHDWSDADAIRLLGRIAADAPSRTRVVVVEGIRRLAPVDDVAHRTDLLMLILAPGGRERTLEEVETIADAAGFNRERVVPLATGDVAHVLKSA